MINIVIILLTECAGDKCKECEDDRSVCTKCMDGYRMSNEGNCFGK